MSQCHNVHNITILKANIQEEKIIFKKAKNTTRSNILMVNKNNLKFEVLKPCALFTCSLRYGFNGEH